MEHDGEVYVGADSAGVSGLDLTVRADEKVFRVGPLLIGFTTSFRMGQLLRFDLKVPKHPKGLDDFAWLVSRLVPAIRRCLSDGGYTTKNNNAETGGQFIVGYRGRLYVVHDDFQVARPASAIAAIGCGYAYALGSLTTQRALNTRDSAGTRILHALTVASEHSAGVCEPFVVMSL
jgi:ATP-dependent protease HslVU (ClpYQ) peptidase subunit